MILEIFLFYYLWIFASILALLYIKVCFLDYKGEPIKIKGFLILIYIIACIIPVVNIGVTFCSFFVISEENLTMKEKYKKFFNSLWIIKVLTKEY